MITKVAIRNLARNRWRTFLTMGGIAIATALLVWMVALMDGMVIQMIEAATEVELGQISIQTVDYAERPSIYDSFAYDEEQLERIEGVADVKGAAPRVRAFGLIGHERRSQVANVVGVDPVREAQTTLLDDAIIEGEWLSSEPEEYPAPREVVLGEGFARQLEVSVGDELVMFVGAADGSLGNELLRVVGIVRTGAMVTDKLGAYMPLADLQYSASLEGRLHEIAITVDDFMNAPQMVSEVEAAAFAEEGALEVRAWQEIIPELSQMIDVNDKSIWFMFLIVYFVVALGIVNAQRMSALERRREFGVLMAVGLKPRLMGQMIMLETIALTLVGAAVGAALGAALAYYHQVHGLNLAALSDQDTFSYMGVSFDGVMYCLMTPKAIWQPVSTVLIVSVVCGLWPAIKSARLNAPQAISGRT